MMRLKKIIFTIGFIVVFILAYHYSPYKIEHVGQRNKVWAYRVSTIEKIDFIQNHYQGMEIDVMFDSERQKLQVKHPNVDCPPIDLKLFLNTLNENKIDGIWFDLKNLHIGNAAEFSNHLGKLTQDFKLKKIVESPNIESLQFFRDKDFKISYYLPGSFDEDAETLASTIKLIKNHLDEFEVDFLSAEMNKYQLAKQHFPNQSLLFWSPRGTFHSEYFIDSWNRNRILNDPKVEILLVRVDFDSGC
ncbi:hypothetical protein [Psychroflexus aestuariivivens]|uniref:hypothetical protein n=1 Tax=Psychroflexus aestuariivivens TaxID=1795040 RepID=UPI000FD8EED7|nr:hypothetical protein [Psychroflexus aestuariivivens]